MPVLAAPEAAPDLLALKSFDLEIDDRLLAVRPPAFSFSPSRDPAATGHAVTSCLWRTLPLSALLAAGSSSSSLFFRHLAAQRSQVKYEKHTSGRSAG